MPDLTFSSDRKLFMSRRGGQRRSSQRRATGDPGPLRNPPWAALLAGFYSRAGLAVPLLEPVTPEAMPRAYRALLVHSRDMTPTLENFYGDRVELTVIERALNDNHYNREVVLTLASSGKPVEYGAIHVYLNHLPAPVRLRVLEERRPFGDILRSEAFPHFSWPQNFFRTGPDAHMATMLRQAKPRVLFGRRNLLLDGSRRLLAEVIEILAPVQAALLTPE